MNELYVDAHCHISSDPWTLNHENDNIKNIIDDVLQSENSSDSKLLLNIMSTSHLDHLLLKKCNAFSNKDHYKLGVGGIHPWYSYIIRLPKHIESYPDVHFIDDVYPNDLYCNYDFVGEVGLDFAANVIKIADIMGLHEIKVNRDHQIKIFQYFLDKFVNLQNLKFISIHSVKASQATFEIIKGMDETLQQKDRKANIVLHSYTGTIEQFNQQYLKLKNINSFISLSTFINCKVPVTKKQGKLISLLDTKHMLIETDVPITTNRKDFEFKKNLENTLNVILNYKKVTFEKS
ncbi:unnamed protein product [Hanseniaspora opuntiae]